MSRLPRISGQQAVATLLKMGFAVRRQHGTHTIMRREVPLTLAVVPNHAELDSGTVRAIIARLALLK